MRRCGKNKLKEVLMGNEKTDKTPVKMLVGMQVVHFGKILFNLQFIVLAVMIASVLSFIIPAIYYVILFAIMLFTLFTVFLWYPEFSSWLSGGETMMRIAEDLAASWKYTVPIAAALAVAVIVCLCFDRQRKQTVRIVISALICVFAVIVFIYKFVRTGV